MEAQGKGPENVPSPQLPRLGKQALKSHAQGSCSSPESRTQGSWPRAWQQCALPPAHAGLELTWGQSSLTLVWVRRQAVPSA